MIITSVYLNNLYCFNDFSYDFTYRKKIVNSTIRNEFLELAPNFKYKKVNIIVGSNASGKTCLGKALFSIFSLLKNKVFDYGTIVNNKNKIAQFKIEIIDDKYVFYHIEGEIISKENILIKIVKDQINFTDTYSKVVQKVKEKINKVDAINYLSLNNEFSFSWNFLFPLTDKTLDSIDLNYLLKNETDYLNIINKVMKTLDPSIKRITKSNEIKDCIIIETKFNSIPIENGRNLKGILYLSSGTKYGLILANIIFAIKFEIFNFVYIDEQFSYLNNDIELNLISLLIDILPDCSQLILTTHNTEVLDMNLPIHSFNFLTNFKKIDLINASERIIKNNISIKNQYENDRFGNLANTSLLCDI